MVYMVKLKKCLGIKCTVWHCTIGWENSHEINTSFGVRIKK
jgi:hypothetical protein